MNTETNSQHPATEDASAADKNMTDKNIVDKDRHFNRVLSNQSAAVFKHQASDFIVSEILPFELSGEGEHLYLHIEKTMCTTLDVERALVKWAGVKCNAVARSGLKDKYAQTRQWFSVHLPGKEDPAQAFDFNDCRVLHAQRHNKKLRIGAHKKNTFEIILREIADPDLVTTNLEFIKQHGVPNYFGEQRFGIQRANLDKAQQCLLQGRRCSRQQRGLYLSAQRSYLFNALLSQRVADNNWNQYVEGDALQLSGTQSHFVPEAHEWNEDLKQRLAGGDVLIAGTLPGVDGVASLSAAQQLESAVFSQFEAWLEYFTKIKLKAQRRSLVLKAEDLSWDFIDSQTLKIDFTLPAGSFATAFLREIIELDEALNHQRL